MFQSWFRGAQPNARWNFFAMGTDIVFFNIGLGISSAYTILPLFVHRLTDLNWIVALIPAIRLAGQLVPPLFVAGYTERKDRAKPFLMRVTLLERLPFLGMALLIIPLSQGNDGWLLVSFFVLLALQNIGAGLGYTGWLDIISRAIPDRLRGRFFGGWFAIGYAVAIGGTGLAVAILAQLTWPWNYTLTFSLTFVAVMISFALLGMTREPERVTHRPPPVGGAAGRRFRAWAGDLAQVVRGDRFFRVYLIANALSGLATIGGGLIAVAALQQAHLTEIQVGLEGTILQVVLMGGFFGWGWLADRFGNRQLLIWGSACNMVAMLAASLATTLPMVTVLFVMFGLSTAAMQLAQLSYVVEFGPAARRPMYIGLAYIGLAPFGAGAPLLGGFLADLIGYRPVFLLGALLSLLTVLAYAYWVRDPRPIVASPALQVGEE